MKKTHTSFVCQSCGAASTRWAGRCASCGEWNTLVEEPQGLPSSPKARKGRSNLPVVSIADVAADAAPRKVTGIGELDRVLGGGIVPGSVVLVGGDPGIGKSTLMMQMAASLDLPAMLYVTGEESPRQIKLRADRLEKTPSGRLLILAETNLDDIEALLLKVPPDLLIVDSIQTMYRPAFESAPGSVSQVRETAALFMRLAKNHEVPVFLVGHVTKEGVIAGPKVIEHMVDVVLQFEGERHSSYRILRAMKNRFGSTNEIGIFEMQDRGLKDVLNPSEVFLAERRSGSPGSAVVAGMEGTRPLLLEVQALVAPTSYGVPQRSTTGFDPKRLQMILAVLERRAGIRVGQYDVFVNVAGGVRIDEPAADLGMAVAIASSLKDQPVDPAAVVIGEVGLGGEIRSIHQIDKRLSEAGTLGFKRVVLPRTNRRGARPPDSLELIEVETIDQAIDALLR
jgi:DNA repair protein RadA/Sms